MPDEKTESLSFAELVGNVTPLAHKDKHPHFARPRQRPVAQALQRRLAAQGMRPAPVARRHDAVMFNLDGIPAERFTAMQRGELPFARIIDLHGYYVADGIARLDDALHQRRNRHGEIWLIIHGKGRNSPAHDRAPLKQAVIDFLCRHPAVAALCSLPDRDRDSGALCIDVYRKPRTPVKQHEKFSHP
ncbi:MAG: Smr/MutS family protein [Cardiobacteriaceae bacterium]|nr:Smr/MutS family protein [Cardiobacteriaceae bacterium]